MTPLSRTTSLLAARIGVAIVVLSLAAFGAWTIGDLLGQPPNQKNARGEEEEDAPKAKPPAKKQKRIEEEEETTPKKPKGKVIIPEGEEPSTPKSESGRSASPASSGNLKQLWEQATNPALRELYHSLKEPHDRVLYKPTSVTSSGERRQREEIVEPLSYNLGSDPGRYHRETLNFALLSSDKFEFIRSYPAHLESVESVRPYEQIAQDKVREFLRQKYDENEPDNQRYLSRYDMLEAGKLALKAVLLWHQSARETGKRKGDEWDAVKKRLLEVLLDEVLLKQLELHAQAKDWDTVMKMTRKLAADYSTDAERERILRPVAKMIETAINKEDPIARDTAKQDACKRLLELDREFPNNPALRSVKESLQILAKSSLDVAKKALEDKDDKKANEYLRQAEMTYPQLPELQTYRRKLNVQHPILRVGVRGPLPQYFSPAFACTDNERRAVDMLFESLVKLVPDKSGRFRYCRGLSESQPKVMPLGRQFKLPPEAVWSDGRPLTSTDIDESLKMLSSGTGAGRSRVWGDMLARVTSDNDPYLVTLRMKQGFLDPLALMTFKILPRDGHVHTREFAQNPVTSGPFLLDQQQSDETRREYRVFMANPDYGRRSSRHDAPHIQEIRFYSYAVNTIAEDLRSGKLDLVLDLTAKEAEQLLTKKNAEQLPIEIPLPSPGAVNRRIYFLAVNTRKLDDATVRQALSCAIDREALLNKHFRGSLKPPLHKALCGPFPAGSWASKRGGADGDDKASPPLFDKAKAALLAAQPAVLDAVKAGALKLKYPHDNPDVAAAMKDLAVQVKALTGLELELEAVSPERLRHDVEGELNYELAYYHYDFPDQCYWLAPLLGPPPGVEDNKNMFRFLTSDLSNLLEGTKSYRDFTKFKEYQQQIQVMLNKQMPFIPLWQLDPLLAYRNDVRPVGLDPLWVFSNIEEWSLVRSK